MRHSNRFERHPVLTGICVLASFLLAGLAGLEVLLRATPLGSELVHDPRPLVPGRHIVLREYPPNATLRFAPPPIRYSSGDGALPLYRIDTDEHGFIEPGRIHPDPDVTIAFLGGSTTECLYVIPENRFPALIGRELERRLGIKVNTINAARSGNNTQHAQLIMQTKLLPLKPDIVVLMENANDLGVLSRYGSYWNDDPNFALVQGDAHGLLAGLRLIRDSLVGYSNRVIRGALDVVVSMTGEVLGFRSAKAIGVSKSDPRVEGWAMKYEASIVQFIQTAHLWGIRPVLMTQVTLESNDRRQVEAGGGNYLADADTTRLHSRVVRQHSRIFQ